MGMLNRGGFLTPYFFSMILAVAFCLGSFTPSSAESIAKSVAKPVNEPTKRNKVLTTLEKVLVQYSKATHLSFSIEKLVRSELLLTETTRQGDLKIEKDRFRFELSGDPKTSMIYDGQNLWVIEGLSATQTKANQRTHPEIALFNRIFFSNALSQDFLISRVSTGTELASGADEVFSLMPKKNSISLTDIRIYLSGNKISRITYRDDLDSLTQMNILSEQRLSRNQKSVFSFKPDPGMKVNKL